jgi:hypothetical protein
MVNEPTTSNPSSGKKRLSHRRKQIYLQIIAGAVILFCGIVIGSGTALLHLKDRVVMRGPSPALNSIVKDIRARYDLTQEQAEQVEDVFGGRRKTLQSLFEEIGQKIDTEFEELSVEMKEILSPEQYERWERDFRTRRRPGPRRRGQERYGPERHGPGRYGPGRPSPGRQGAGRPGQRPPGPRRPDLWEPRLPEPNVTPE